MYPVVYNNHSNSRYIIKSNEKGMHKSAIFGLFLMASLLLGTSVNMNMFSSANAQGMGQYDNSYQQSTTEMIHMEVVAMTKVTVMISQQYYGPQQPSYGPQQPSYDKPRYDY